MERPLFSPLIILILILEVGSASKSIDLSLSAFIPCSCFYPLPAIVKLYAERKGLVLINHCPSLQEGMLTTFFSLYFQPGW